VGVGLLIHDKGIADAADQVDSRAHVRRVGNPWSDLQGELR
jgi:hypothetical protein